ncbi:MAG: lipoyl(octanoyl) transferase LipB [Kiritimatiellia bacterium]
MNANAIFINRPVPYRDGLVLQEIILEKRIRDEIADTVIFLEHLPVITLGVRSKPEQVLLPADELRARRIELTESSRGGAATFHCPGQLVMYPVIKLGAGKADAHGYLHNLEEVAIRTAAGFGVAACRRPGMTGAWTEMGKLSAIGVRFKRWVTWHGMSFNVKPDMAGFDAIIPCGLKGERVASLQSLLGASCPSIEKVRRVMAAQFSAVFCREISVLRRESFKPWQTSSFVDRLD